MRRTIVAALVGIALPPAAYALPSIPSGSEINVTGSALFNTTSIAFTNPADIPIGGTTGGFAGLGNCTGCATMSTPFAFNPFTAGQLYSVSNNGLTATFSVSANTFLLNSGTDLIIHDNGTFTLSGFAPTKGTMSITVNQGEVTGSFSSTGLSSGGGGGGVPEPTTLAILGTALIGLGVARRKLT